MSKVFGLQGFLRGKLGNTVFAIRNGEQIARQYNPNPANPKSVTQTANRARLKLLSQLGAALQPVIAVPRVGMVSPRNGFTQANYPYTTFAVDNASISLASIQLTKSSVPLGQMNIDADLPDTITVNFSDNLSSSVDAVTYVMLRRTTDEKVAVVTSKLVSKPGEAGTFETTFPKYNADIAVLAYGIRYNTSAARVVFGNLTAPSAEAVAKLFANRTLTASDVTMTKTVGLYVPQA